MCGRVNGEAETHDAAARAHRTAPGRGIGARAAELLARNGASVVVNDVSMLCFLSIHGLLRIWITFFLHLYRMLPAECERAVAR